MSNFVRIDKDQIVGNLLLLADKDIYSHFALYSMVTKAKTRIPSLPPFPLQNLKNRALGRSDSEDMIQILDRCGVVLNLCFTIYNAIPMKKQRFNSRADIDIASIKYTQAVSGLINRISREPAYISDSDVNMVYGYLSSCMKSLGLPDNTETDMTDWFRYLLHMPILLTQIKKQKIAVGVHSVTKKPLYKQLQIVYPTEARLNRSKMFPEMHRLTQKEILSESAGYFVFPLTMIYRLFTEKDLDLLPDRWSHTVFMEYRNIPDVGGNYEDILRHAVENRRYVIPEDGVIIRCSNFGDIKQITFKETRSFGSLVCYAKVSFSDGMDDIVIINAETGGVFSSGYGDIYGREKDLVVKIVAKAYDNLVAARRIVTASGKETFARGQSTTTSDKSQSFSYIPRTTYKNGIQQEVRRRIEKVNRSPHPVSGYTRRGKATPEALARAKQDGVFVPEGETYVQAYYTGSDDSKGSSNHVSSNRRTVRMKNV